MKKLGLLSLLAALLVIGAYSCKNDDAVKEEARQSLSTQNTQPAASSVANSTPQNAPQNAPSKVEEVPVGPTTSIKYDNETHDFGKVMEGEVVYHTYKFTNTGDEPLIIKNAKASCGCTVPQWPRNPIAPGETGEMQVKFDTKGRGKAGGKPQSKRVTVTANTNPSKTYVTIKGLVDKAE
jgi:hypothetical protein